MRTSMDVDRRTGDSRGLAQERRLALVGLDQVERHTGGQGENQAGEAGAGAEVDGTIAGLLDQRGELQRIGDVALPEQRLIAR